MSSQGKVRVEFIGFMEPLHPDEPPLAQVNVLEGPIRTTLTYDQTRHKIINLDEYEIAFAVEAAKILRRFAWRVMLVGVANDN